MQICRICLAADRKMFPISDRVHIYEQITGLTYSSEDFLPKYECWECRHYMSKYVAFKRRAVMSYCTLIEILKKDGLITETSIANCYQTTLTSTNTLCLLVQEEYDNLIVYDNNSDKIVTVEKTDIKDESLVQEEYDNLIVYDNSDKTATVDKTDIKDESIKNLEDESLIKDETLLSDDVIVSSACIELCFEGTDSIKVENQSPAKFPSVKRKRTAKACEIRISKDNKKNSSEKCKKSNNITKLVAVKRKVSTIKEKKDVKLSIDELDKELLHITELPTLEEQIAEIQNKKESDNYLNSPHTCDNCFKGFHDLAAYKRHITRYSESRGPHACPVCRMRFRRPFLLNEHIKKHAYKISCTVCNFSTSYITAAKHHQNYHNGKTYKCPHCEEVFRHRSTYLGHLRIKHPSDFVCKYCGYTFLNERGLQQHVFRNHRDARLVPADGPACARCDIRFSCQEALDTHRRVSAKHADERIVGVVKPLRNSTPQDYRRVCYSVADNKERTLSSEPFPNGPRPCHLCEKLLPNPKAYSAHEEAHRKRKGIEKTRICEICGKLCTSAITLSYHLHRHRVTKDFKCDGCGKLFRTYGSLHQHKRNHCGAGVKHPCSECGKTFSSPTNLKRHMQVHKGLSFQCEFCGKKFRGQGNKKQHVDHVHKMKPWIRRNRVPREQAAVSSSALETIEQNPSYETEADMHEEWNTP